MEYRCNNKTPKKKKKVKKFFAVFLVFFLLAFLYLEFVVNPVIVSATKQTVLSLSSTAVSNAVFDVINEKNITYNDLVDITYDDDGNVAMVNFQSGKMNILAREIYQKAQNYIEEMGQTGIEVPLGAFSGLPFLAGFGPKVRLKMVSVGAVSSIFENTFSSVGINQTNHAIYVDISASVDLLLPAYKCNVDSVTEVLIAQCIIVGKVPSTYLGKTEEISFATN